MRFLLPAVLVLLVNCAAPAPEPPPNFLVLMADDLGYTDLGAFGGGIRTPQLDRLAAAGTRFTSFYTAATCSPTRAMLLSGVDHHRAGLGGMASLMGDDLEGRIGYEGYLNEHVLHLPQLMRDAGYHTSIAGKWHLGQADDQSPPMRGFDRSFVLLTGAASHFEDAAPVDSFDPIRYRRDGAVVPLPEGFYSTRAYTDELIGYIKEATALGKPFFALGTYTAPHWPLQVPDPFLDLYAGAYDDGWGALVETRFTGALRMGVIPETARIPPLPDYARDWNDLTSDERRTEARKMELYAAMVERLDHHVGRLIGALREMDLYDNTVIVFFSDNGASGADVMGLADNATFVPANFDLSYERMGQMRSFVFTGPEWAHASTAPFRYFKQFVHEGGIRVPAFAVLPERLNGRMPGATVHTFVHVTDLFPTFLDLAGAAAPPPGAAPVMPTGRSLTALLTGEADRVHQDVAFGWEIFGRRAIRRGPWKATWLAPPMGDRRWRLYNLEQDPGELRDLAADEPRVLDAMLADWEGYVKDAGVIVTDEDRGFGRPVPIR